MFEVRDPNWKLNPDIVADESARERYDWGYPDEEEDEDEDEADDDERDD